MKTRVLLLMLIIFCLPGCAPRQAKVTACSSLSIEAPASIPAGKQTRLTILAPSADGALVKVIATGSYGSRVFAGPIQEGQWVITLAEADTRVTGLIHFKAICGDKTASAEMRITPGGMVEPLRPLVGARSILADGSHWSMVVVIPVDRHGNPVADGTSIQIEALHPGNNLEQQEILTTNLLGWSRIFSGTQAGKTRISVRSGTVSGPEGLLLEVPGLPVPFILGADPPGLPADGNSWLILRTDVLKDQYDNILPDGTLVTFVVDMGDGKRHSIPTYTIDGSAAAPLQAPGREQTAVVHGYVQGISSFPLNITFTPNIPNSSFPVQAKKELERGVLVLTAGPILGSLSQYVPDATPVSFTVIAPNGQVLSLESFTESGYASLDISLGEVGTGQIEIKASAGSGFGSVIVEIP